MSTLYNIFHGGGSSLLFIISATQSLLTSEILLWKLSNILIIITSYLSNTYFCENYRFFDYIVISSLAMIYINNYVINSIFLLCFFVEFLLKKNISLTKNIVFLSACILALFNTFHSNYELYLYLLLVMIIGILALQYRNIYYDSSSYTPIGCLLTTIWHLCAVSGLLILSYNISM